MPTRRQFELMIVAIILARPVLGLFHLWSVKTLQTQQPGTFIHGTAQVVKVLS